MNSTKQKILQHQWIFPNILNIELLFIMKLPYSEFLKQFFLVGIMETVVFNGVIWKVQKCSRILYRRELNKWKVNFSKPCNCISSRSKTHTDDTRVIIHASSNPPVSLMSNSCNKTLYQINKQTNLNHYHIINQSNSNSIRW